MVDKNDEEYENDINDICRALEFLYCNEEEEEEEDEEDEDEEDEDEINKIDEIDDRQKIINLFRTNVKNKKLDTTQSNKSHDGKEGHALEKLMNIKHNANNLPDLYGYEMKKDANKITFGDFTASEYLFSNSKDTINKINGWNNNQVKLSRIDFIKTFGTKNVDKNNRYAWSGSCIPKYNIFNYNGTIFKFNEKNDLCIYYSYDKDTRKEKNTFQEFLKKNDVLIVIWLKDKLMNHVNKKFNDKGFFICSKNKKTNLYDKIGFGKPFSFDFFVENFKTGKIFFDSGMYNGNDRNYSQFRANSNFWHELITEEFS